ncbi:hypothetical protein V6N13_102359 [Hibiscus sabdariffa]|uniref:Hexosyltransferase n=1 Tax=Hibiscus sabdariffa TaxID=183260 RepID=A0ABR2D3V6_9ROSI
MAPGVPVDSFSTLAKVNGGYSRKVFVTFLAGYGDYIKGVVGLAKGLRKVKSAYPLVVAILPDVPREHREIMQSQGCIVREIEPIYPRENQVQFAMAHFVINYSKLRIWNFEEYNKMVYLDADIQVYDNIDHLLDTPNGYLYAVMDCYCEKVWNQSLQYSIGYCQQCPDKTLRITPPTPFAEQDFLNMFFQNVYKPTPVIYNLVLAMLWRHPENVDINKVKVAHYCAAGSKPWRYTGKEDNMQREDIKMLVAKWWDIYNDASLDFNAENPDPEADQTAFSKTSIMASMPDQPEIPYIPAPTAA